MNKKEIVKTLRSILNKADTDIDSIVTRKSSVKHNNDIDVLIEHISILIADLRFDAECSRRELFLVRQALEE